MNLPFKIDKGISYPDDIHRKAMRWCIKNDIIVKTIPLDNMRCKIKIIDKGKTIIGQQIYRTMKLRKNDIEWWGVVWAIYYEYYKYYNTNK